MITVPIVGEIPKELQDKIKEKARQKEKQKQKQEKQEDHKFKYDGHFSDLEDSDLEDWSTNGIFARSASTKLVLNQQMI